ncbi:hypothetical protein MKW94_018884 [Papaver nudicaule]|uniref:RRM domain-containing protein n=1 Tax=Papaver nudicaule TaxID=74823 RepID=A0AA42AY97_PAPNU|nr:hypothetical protein [Papaver nudicaule]
MAPSKIEKAPSYHRDDRELYSRLVMHLCRDPFRSIDVMAFWMCLADAGLPYIVPMLIVYQDHVVDAVADETILIFSCMTSKIPPPKSKNINVLPLTQSFLDNNRDFSLSFLYENRSTLISEITRKVNEVCIKAFYDILQKAVEKKPGFLQSTTFLVFEADRYRSELSAKHVLKEERRSIIVAFHRGSPMSDRDLMEYFAGLYGNCIERVQPQERKQPQYARVVFRSASTVKTFLGGQEKVKFDINGKQLSARRYRTI